ncbi:hypothetical protein LOK49_LG08G02090 [Camellia lanceoleosa]|uniref:Uncharacterized protein n=1 Tax=Camellia lanceoleosa TaxID=1840588 RepID=A0ACC0GW42_9ERIC|nr:hypothetical protein LOK49_LG08G02090 [Camellia lanceoleosa]
MCTHISLVSVNFPPNFPGKFSIRFRQMEDKDFYRLSKKELQDLCKSYGLSPYMTKSNLVNSLSSYFKKKNWSSVSQVEGSIIHSTSMIPPLECGAREDNMVHAPEGEKENTENRSQTVKCNEQGGFVGGESYSKASGFQIVRDVECPLYNVPENSHLTCKKRETSRSQNELGHNENGFGYRVESPKISSDKNNLSFAREVGVNDAPQIQSRNLNHGACLVENASFSEEGINLVVDFNSTPSDWFNRLESKACGCHKAHDNKFGSLQMKNSSLWNADLEHEKNNCHGKAESFSYPVKGECDPVVVDHPYGGDGSLRFSPVKPCNVATEMSAQLEEDKELPLFSTPNSDIHNHATSGRESCLIDRETFHLESSVIKTPQIKSSSDSVVNSTVESPKICTAGASEVRVIRSCKPTKDASCFPCRNNGFLDVVDPMLNVETIDGELANSSTCQDHMSACAGEQEKSKLINGAETSVSLQLKKSLEKTSEDSKADKVLKRKKQHSEVEDLKCGEPNEKILRSRKHLLDRELPRRSTRLVPK